MSLLQAGKIYISILQSSEGDIMAGELQVYFNGEYVPESKAGVSVFDHGFLYGDGVFEGIRAYNGRIFKLKEHVERLYESANAIALKPPLEQEEFCKAILTTCRINNLRDAYIRPIVTRGVGDLNINPRSCKTPNVIIIAKPLTPTYGDKYEKGLKLITAPVTRTPPQCLSPNIKSLNYLNNILARIYANQYGADEALLLDINGYVSEATADNIFYIKNGVVGTPPTATNLKGITRATVLELAQKLGYDTRVTMLTLFDIYNADEIFITGTAAEVAPCVEVDGRKIADGKPGKVSLHLMKEYRELVRNTGEEIFNESKQKTKN